jgi:hypothetical protein
VIPEKANSDFVNSALAQLEEIIAELEFIENLTDFDTVEGDKVTLESAGFTEIVPPQT